LLKKGEKDQMENINNSGRDSIKTDASVSGKLNVSKSVHSESQGLLDNEATEDRAPEQRIVEKSKPTFR